MPRTPLTQEQAQQLVSRWLGDHLPTPGPATQPGPEEVAGWLDWEESDLAFIVDVDLPAELTSQLTETVVDMPRLDVAGDAGDGIVEAPIDPSELRLLVDRHTGQVAAAERGEPIAHVLELWRQLKGMDDETTWIPDYEPPYESDRVE